jgi:CRISPR-associated endonuclease/helicase Cas3
MEEVLRMSEKRMSEKRMNEKEIYARKYEFAGKVYRQTLKEHLDGVAKRCSRHAEAFDSAEWGRLLGQVHDIGKARQEFQDKLNGRAIRVEHSGAGAVLLAKQKNLSKSDFKSNLSRAAMTLTALAAAGHHAGLSDIFRFNERLKKNEPVLLQTGEFGQMPDFDAELPAWLRTGKSADGQSIQRSLEFWARFLFSALVDADRLDAEFFELRSRTPEGMEVRTGFESIEQ